MLTLQMIVLGSQMALLGLFLFYTWKAKDAENRDRDWVGPVEELKLKNEVMETRWKRLLEELHERVEKGNEAWRRVRAAETARQRREELKGDLEGESDEVAQEVLPLHEEGGDPRGMPYVQNPLGTGPEEPWRIAARQLAQSIAGIES